MVNYEKGTIHFMSDVETRTSNGRDYSNMTLVLAIQTSASSFKYLALKVSGDRIDDVLQFQNGDKVEVGFNVSAREYNGKWYSNVDLINIKGEERPQPQGRPSRRDDQDQLNTQMHNDLPF